MQNPAERIADEILVMDAQSGHREAFDMLVSRWQKRLWWHAFNLTGRTEAAWDITQESWLDIVRGLTRLNDPAKFGSWAYRIVSQKAYDWRYRDGRECSPEIETEDTPAVTAEQGKHETASDVQRHPPPAAGPRAGGFESSLPGRFRSGRDRRNPRNARGHGEIPSACGSNRIQEALGIARQNVAGGNSRIWKGITI